MLFGEGIRGGICTAIRYYAEANNKYKKNYDSTKKSIYLIYVDANNLYGYPISQKLPIKNFKFETDLSIFTENFIKNYNEQSNTGYLLVVDVIYPTHFYKEHRDLPFLPYRGKVNKVNKLLCGLNDKNNYSI